MIGGISKKLKSYITFLMIFELIVGCHNFHFSFYDGLFDQPITKMFNQEHIFIPIDKY